MFAAFAPRTREALGLGKTGLTLPVFCCGRTGGSPSFPRDPMTALPCSPTPGEPPRLTTAAFRYGPRYHKHEGFPNHQNFEAQSHGFTACCLRLKTPFRVADQDSLPVAGQALPVGSLTRGVSIETFCCCSVFCFHFAFCFFPVQRHPRLSGLWLAPCDWKWVAQAQGRDASPRRPCG